MSKRWMAPQVNDRHHRLCDCKPCNADKERQTPEQRRLDEAKRNGLVVR